MSKDGGTTWVKLNQPIPDNNYNSIQLGPNRNIFIKNSGKLYFSNDEGISWNKIVFPDSSFVTTFKFGLNGYIFVGARIETSESYSGVYRSKDMGENWIFKKLNDFQGILSLRISENGTLWAGTTGTDVLSMSGGIYYSVDKGENWIETRWWGYEDVHSILPCNNNRIMVGTISGLFYSDDNGYTWDLLNLKNKPVFILAENTDGIIFAASYWIGIFRSFDNGENWEYAGLKQYRV
ncbi:MAG: WD40/YVTN/BNR-like repeat-containing protein, partial [Calditrichia bacterium]